MIPIQAMKCLEICIYIYTYVQYIGKCIKGTCIGNILYSSLYMENVLIAI